MVMKLKILKKDSSKNKNGFIKEKYIPKKKKLINSDKYTFINIKRFFNSWIGRVRLFLSKFDFHLIIKETLTWLTEAFIEGITLNFALTTLFKIPFTLSISLSLGIIIKEILYFIKRIIQNGSNK
jgi:hypothetical protein